MHESARRGLRTLVAGAGVLALIVIAIVALLRGCRSDEEIVSAAVDDARDALVERDADAFMEFFGADVTYRGSGGHDALARDVARWTREMRGGRITIVERRIDMDGDGARISLRCDVGNILQTFLTVDVTLLAERREGRWLVTRFDWK